MRASAGACAGFTLALSAVVWPVSNARAQPDVVAEPSLIDVTLECSGRFGGESLSYTVTAKEQLLSGDEGRPEATVFSVAYSRTDGDRTSRPVVFSFNGGPGSSSAWLHIGALGPNVIDLSPDHPTAAGRAIARHNPASILGIADIVFVDPVGTGFSRVLDQSAAGRYWGVEQDADYLADFIRRYLDANDRWPSPIYLVGESYGALRVSRLAEELAAGFSGIRVDGVILVSGVVDMAAVLPLQGFGEAYVYYLPSFAATALFHGKLPERPGGLDALIADAREFALTEFAAALFLGNRLSENKKRQIAERVSKYIGLPADYINQSDLRVGPLRFAKELRRPDGLAVGRWDSRYAGREPDRMADAISTDASAYRTDGPFVSAINHYLRHSLGVTTDQPYRLLNVTVGQSWDWETENRSFIGPSFVNAVPGLVRAMHQNAELRVLVAAGYYDLATPFLSMESSLARDGVPADRVAFKYYEAGHMLYLEEETRGRFLDDLKQFLSGSGD